MTALSVSLDAIEEGVRRVVDYTEDTAAAAVDLAELCDTTVVHEAVAAAFKCQDAAHQLRTALARLQDLAS